jgi:hypothetical protein
MYRQSPGVSAPPLAFVELSSAAWGFIGVVVGAALSIVKDFVVEGRRAKREREAESRREKVEVQIACRLVAEELDTIALDARTLTELQRTPDLSSQTIGSFCPRASGTSTSRCWPVSSTMQRSGRASRPSTTTLRR